MAQSNEAVCLETARQVLQLGERQFHQASFIRQSLIIASSAVTELLRGKKSKCARSPADDSCSRQGEENVSEK